MELTKYVIAVAAVPIVLLLLHGPHSAQAYWSDEFGHGWLGNEGWNDGLGLGDGGWHGGGGGESGYHAGVVDAQSDFQSNSAFTPYPSYCCHSWLYKQAFADGYQHEWNVLQEQQQNSNQELQNNVNIENSPGAHVVLNNGQTNDQGQGQGQGVGYDENGGGCCGP